VTLLLLMRLLTELMRRAFHPAARRTCSLRYDQQAEDQRRAQFGRPNGGSAPYIEAFNNGDESAMGAACADPMQILDSMSPHVWQGSTAAEDWWKDVLAEGEHLVASGYRITLDEPRHVDVNGDHAYVVAPASMTFELRGQQITQTGSVYTVALRKVDADWRLTAWAWAKGA
jgi:ketosteroid isomerase-like protein